MMLAHEFICFPSYVANFRDCQRVTTTKVQMLWGLARLGKTPARHSPEDASHQRTQFTHMANLAGTVVPVQLAEYSHISPAHATDVKEPMDG